MKTLKISFGTKGSQVQILSSRPFIIVLKMDKNILRILGKNIKIERIRNDLSQEQLAEKAGVSTRTISLIENGLQHPKLFLIVKISKILNVDINVFLENIPSDV